MGKLHTFLRKEVLASRLRPPSDDYLAETTPEDLNPGTTNSVALHQDDDSLILGASIHGSFKHVADDEADSIFGEHILTRDERREQRLKELLSRSSVEAPRLGKQFNPVLQRLKEEVATLMSLESQAGQREWELIQRQKVHFLEEIRHLEAEEDLRAYRGRKDQVMGRIENLPEPIGMWEKKRLLMTANKLSKSRAAMNMDSDEEAPETPSPKKRRKPDYNLEEKFDGEDRLRYGQPIKLPAPQITGHWRATIHDYIPASQESLDFFGMSAEQKKLMRMELADYAQQAARLDRKQKRMKVTEDWLMRNSGQYGFY